MRGGTESGGTNVSKRNALPTAGARILFGIGRPAWRSLPAPPARSPPLPLYPPWRELRGGSDAAVWLADRQLFQYSDCTAAAGTRGRGTGNRLLRDALRYAGRRAVAWNVDCLERRRRDHSHRDVCLPSVQAPVV